MITAHDYLTLLCLLAKTPDALVVFVPPPKDGHWKFHGQCVPISTLARHRFTKGEHARVYATVEQLPGNLHLSSCDECIRAFTQHQVKPVLTWRSHVDE